MQHLEVQWGFIAEVHDIHSFGWPGFHHVFVAVTLVAGFFFFFFFSCFFCDRGLFSLVGSKVVSFGSLGRRQ